MTYDELIKNMENSYYDLTLMSGKTIIETRKRIQEDDRVVSPKYYDIEIEPDKYYMASIIYEDITYITSIYIEEIIYEKHDR